MKININGERVVLQLQRSIQPKDWDSKRAKVIGRSHEAREFNDDIDSVITRTRQKYSELITMHDTVTPQLLRDAVLGVNTAKARMIIEIGEDHIEGLRKLIGKESPYATCQKYNAAKNHFSNFLRIKYKVSDVPIKSIGRSSRIDVSNLNIEKPHKDPEKLFFGDFRPIDCLH